MASTDAALTTGADQNAGVRRRNVPGTEDSRGNVPAVVRDEQDVKVHRKVSSSTTAPFPAAPRSLHGVADNCPES